LYVAEWNNHKIRKIVIATGAVSTFAGTGVFGAADGAGSTATFNRPTGITTDNTNLYVVDTFNHKIRQIVIATGVVSTLAGTGVFGAADGAGTTATFDTPYGITTDGTNLFVADMANQKIRKVVITTGVVSSLTGVANTATTWGAADGAGSVAKFNNPQGITVFGSVLYVADANNSTIRTVSVSTAAVATLAGHAAVASDGIGGAASFNTPNGITSDGSNLYVADTWNNKIRKIVIATGAVSTLAGTGALGAFDGAGTSATFNGPYGITTDGTNLFVTDWSNSAIRKIVIATGVVSTLAGGALGVTDGIGAAALFNGPSGITTDGINLYVADFGNNKIRKIVIATAAVSSLTGGASAAVVSGAVDGSNLTASFNMPSGITTDGVNLYVADSGNNKIRQIVISSGAVSSMTGTANTVMVASMSDGAGINAAFKSPQDITCDGLNLYVTDALNQKIRKIVLATGMVSSLNGAANIASSAGSTDGVGATATFNTPYGITSDGVSLYVTDSGNNTIRKIQ
jgi:sugar lactone lactonase YvrE